MSLLTRTIRSSSILLFVFVVLLSSKKRDGDSSSFGMAFAPQQPLAARSMVVKQHTTRTTRLRAHSTNYTLTAADCHELDTYQFIEAMNQHLPELQQQQQSLLLDESVSTTTTTKTANSFLKNKVVAISDLWKARLLLIGASALYGTNFSMVKLLGDTMPVGVSGALRFGLAAMVTFPWLIKDIDIMISTPKDGNSKRNNKDALTAAWLGFEVGLLNSIGYVTQAVGLETTPASESAFICSLAVVTVPLIEFAVGKKLHHRQWVGALCAVLGVAFLELGGDVHNMMNMGDILSLVQPFAFGFGFWKMEQAMHRFPDQASRLTAAQLFAVFLSSVAYGCWDTDLATLQSYPWGEWMTSSSVLFGLFWTGLITTALTIYMETKAMETLSAAETTLIFSTEPLWGTAFAAGVMGEQLGLNTLVGAGFILTACVYSNLGWKGIQKMITSADDTNEGVVGDVENNEHVLRNLLSSQGIHPHSLRKQSAWASNRMAAKWASWKMTSDVADTGEEAISILLQKLL